MTMLKSPQSKYLYPRYRCNFFTNPQVNRISITEDHDIVADWNRTGNGAYVIYINGQLLPDLRGTEESFKNKNELSNFFRGHLVHHLPEEERDKAVEMLMKIMHQGGLRSPMAAAANAIISSEFQDIDLGAAPCDVDPGDPEKAAQERQLNIITTPNGLKVQEIVKQKVVRIGEEYIRDPSGDHPLYKAEVSFQVNFRPADPDQAIVFLGSSIEFGEFDNPELQKNVKHLASVIDKRSFWERFVDAIKYLLGVSKVRNYAYVEDQHINSEGEIIETPRPSRPGAGTPITDIEQTNSFFTEDEESPLLRN